MADEQEYQDYLEYQAYLAQQQGGAAPSPALTPVPTPTPDGQPGGQMSSWDLLRDTVGGGAWQIGSAAGRVLDVGANIATSVFPMLDTSDNAKTLDQMYQTSKNSNLTDEQKNDQIWQLMKGQYVDDLGAIGTSALNGGSIATGVGAYGAAGKAGFSLLARNAAGAGAAEIFNSTGEGIKSLFGYPTEHPSFPLLGGIPNNALTRFVGGTAFGSTIDLLGKAFSGVGNYFDKGFAKSYDDPANQLATALGFPTEDFTEASAANNRTGAMRVANIMGDRNLGGSDVFTPDLAKNPKPFTEAYNRLTADPGPMTQAGDYLSTMRGWVPDSGATLGDVIDAPALRPDPAAIPAVKSVQDSVYNREITSEVDQFIKSNPATAAHVLGSRPASGVAAWENVNKRIPKLRSDIADYEMQISKTNDPAIQKALNDQAIPLRKELRDLTGSVDNLTDGALTARLSSDDLVARRQQYMTQAKTAKEGGLPDLGDKVTSSQRLAQYGHTADSLDEAAHMTAGHTEYKPTKTLYQDELKAKELLLALANQEAKGVAPRSLSSYIPTLRGRIGFGGKPVVANEAFKIPEASEAQRLLQSAFSGRPVIRNGLTQMSIGLGNGMQGPYASAGLTGLLGANDTPGKGGVAYAEDLNPAVLSNDLVTPVPKQGIAVPRNLNAFPAEAIEMLIAGYAPPEQAAPIIQQWKRVAAGGDKQQMAQMLGALTQAFPDMPFARGQITGLPSEFDIGDGVARLFAPEDMARWEDQIDQSDLRLDEKAHRVMVLRQSGRVLPMDVNVVNLSPNENPTMTPSEQALSLLSSKRVPGALGIRKIQ